MHTPILTISEYFYAMRCGLYCCCFLLTCLLRSPRPPRPPLQGYLSSRGYRVAARELVSELPPHFIPEEHRHLIDAPPICSCPTQAKAAPQAAPAQGDQLKLPLSSTYCYCTGKTQLNVISFAQNLSLIKFFNYHLTKNKQKQPNTKDVFPETLGKGRPTLWRTSIHLSFKQRRAQVTSETL